MDSRQETIKKKIEEYQILKKITMNKIKKNGLNMIESIEKKKKQLKAYRQKNIMRSKKKKKIRRREKWKQLIQTRESNK